MIFIEQFNFTFREYPHDYDDDDKDPLMEAMQLGHMDFTSFPAYPYRTNDASDVLWNANIYIMVPKSQPIAKYKYFYKPFDEFVWLQYLVVIVEATSVVAFLTLRKYSIWDFSKSFIYICSIALYQYQLATPVRSLRFNLLYILLIVYNFIMINYYLCMLSSLLVSTLYEPQIDTIEALASTSLRFKATQTDIDYYTQLPDISPIIVSLFTVEDGIVLDNLRRNLSTDMLHSAIEDKLQFYVFQQKYLKVPRLHLIPSAIYSCPIYFSIRHNLPYLELFNRYLRNLWASGILWKTHLSMEWYGILSGEIHYLRDEESPEHLLTLEYFYSPLGFYCIGVIISLI
ncbi:uncharacterized protein LOC133332935, partial [Musca vetustissima]|uniref:uncharacterized protein LOC133332935 n=1 Tax=Musca vetustissima TaxID=27455 RepID=UPI002AB7688E